MLRVLMVRLVPTAPLPPMPPDATVWLKLDTKFCWFVTAMKPRWPLKMVTRGAVTVTVRLSAWVAARRRLRVQLSMIVAPIDRLGLGTLPTIEPTLPGAQYDQRIEQLGERIKELEARLARMEVEPELQASESEKV